MSIEHAASAQDPEEAVSRVDYKQLYRELVADIVGWHAEEISIYEDRRRGYESVVERDARLRDDPAMVFRQGRLEDRRDMLNGFAAFLIVATNAGIVPISDTPSA